MRHFLAASAVPGLAGRVVEPAGTALLIEAAGPLQRDPTRMIRADARAVAVSAVADPAQEEELLAVRSDVNDQPQRIHALPRSGRGGWTTTRRCAKKGAADRALPRCVPPEGPGCRDSGPSPLSAVGGNGLPQLTVLSQTDSTVSRSQIPRFLLIVNNGTIVGDATYLTLVHGQRLPPPKFMEIAGHVWLLERTAARCRFLIFGNQRRVAECWLEKYGGLVDGVEFYFLADDGTLEQLR